MNFFESPQLAVLRIFAVLLALTVHEASHAWAADSLGDPTPRLRGRLSLNPLAHLDVLGTIFFFIVGLGWAKPVPVNPSYFKNPRRDDFLVSLAGPLSNITLAILMAVSLRFFDRLIPLAQRYPIIETPLEFAFGVATMSVMMNIGLAFFNLIPIPPLDGSGIVASLLPPRLSEEYQRMGQYGFLVLFALVFLGAFEKLLFPLIDAASGALLG
ncbi:site-2 protease family protein [bacterium]|nr:MAG: site-2 protease family protein [bacterium]